MDCSAEEQLVRMKLTELPAIKQLFFDLKDRKLEVLHEGDVQPILKSLQELKFDESLISTQKAAQGLSVNEVSERQLLIYVLLINAFFFILEMVTGLVAHSMGLVADSLDMLADALVYYLSLIAVGKAISRKKRVARLSGYLQLSLAIGGFIEVLRRVLGYGEMPVFSTMIYISILALVGNALCLVILRKTNSDEAHIQASQIFTSNDVIINCGVVLAGILVYFTNSRLPDLIVGFIVFIIVLKGSFRILKLSR